MLDHFNYKDGLALTVDHNDVAYAKAVDALRLRCEVLKERLGWAAESDWHFAVLSSDKLNFYFLLQRKFDPYEDKKHSRSGSSRKTVSKDLSARSDKHKVDPLAKTVSNLDLFRLKQQKNELLA